MRRGWGKRLVFGSAGSIAGTVYGTIIVMATVTAGSNGEQTDAWRLSVIVVATVLVLWIAHVYAHALAESLERRRRLDRRELASVARRELAIPAAAVAPVAALVLGGLRRSRGANGRLARAGDRGGDARGPRRALCGR